MLYFPTVKTYPLSEDDESVNLTAYIAPACEEMTYNTKRRGILICPGGGYAYCSQREGDPIAQAFIAKGFNAFVLGYTVNNKNHKGKKFPAQLIEAASAMKLIKDHAEEFCVDPDKIFVIGFSAGGHLAASLGILYGSKYVTDALGIDENYARPAGMLLGYPVITSGRFAHRGSIENILLDEKENEDALLRVSLEKQVSDTTVPAFIWHTRPDNCVPVENSLMLADALAEHNIPFEFHVYPNGGHGMSLANELVGYKGTYRVSHWFEEAVCWMRETTPEDIT